MFENEEVRDFVNKNVPIEVVMRQFYNVIGGGSFPCPFPAHGSKDTHCSAKFLEGDNTVYCYVEQKVYTVTDVLDNLSAEEYSCKEVMEFLSQQMRDLAEVGRGKDMTGLGQVILDLIAVEMEFGDLGAAYTWPEGLAEKLDGTLQGFNFPEGEYPTADLMKWITTGGFRELEPRFNLLKDVMLVGKVDVDDLTYKTLLAVVAGDGQLEEVKQNARAVLDTMERRR